MEGGIGRREVGRQTDPEPAFPTGCRGKQQAPRESTSRDTELRPSGCPRLLRLRTIHSGGGGLSFIDHTGVCTFQLLCCKDYKLRNPITKVHQNAQIAATEMQD